MSLDITLYDGDEELHWQNITHNLGRMADDAGFYEVLWRAEENGIETAGQLIEPLQKGITAMQAEPDRFKKFNAFNGWGTYDQFVPWLIELLVKCTLYPNAKIETSR